VRGSAGFADELKHFVSNSGDKCIFMRFQTPPTGKLQASLAFHFYLLTLTFQNGYGLQILDRCFRSYRRHSLHDIGSSFAEAARIDPVVALR